VRSNIPETATPAHFTFLGASVAVMIVLVLILFTIGSSLNPFYSLLGLDTEAGLWYLTRAAGLVAYLLLWLSTVWGLAVASKIFDPVLHRAFTFDVHEFLSLIALGFAGLHIGVLLVDAYLPFSLWQVLVPLTAPYRPVWVGIGVIGLYLTLLVTVTFYLRSRIGQKNFRAIHLLSFLAYSAVTLHSFFAGTDSKLGSAQFIYASSALVIVILSVFWFARTRMTKPPTPAVRTINAR
jgi:sulfoxide reductase heme-binding subunit YedZ